MPSEKRSKQNAKARKEKKEYDRPVVEEKTADSTTSAKKTTTKKRRKPNLTLSPVKSIFRDALYNLFFKDLANDISEKLQGYQFKGNTLYKIDGENCVVIMEVVDDLLMAHKNFIMGLLTKIIPRYTSTVVKNVSQEPSATSEEKSSNKDKTLSFNVPNVPMNMFKVLCYDGTQPMNSIYVMKHIERVFDKKIVEDRKTVQKEKTKMTDRDVKIVDFWSEVIENGNSNLSECISKLNDYRINLDKQLVEHKQENITSS